MKGSRAVGAGLLAILMPCGGEAQEMMNFLDPGLPIFILSNEPAVRGGGSYWVRWVTINTGDTAATPQWLPCEAVRAKLPLQDTELVCPEQELPLQPGDSAWAEIRGAHNPGDADARMNAPSELYENFIRLPVILEVDNRSSRTDLQLHDILLLVHRATQTPLNGRVRTTQVIPFATSRVAALRMSPEWPFLDLRLEVDSVGGYVLWSCLRGSGGEALYPSCNRPRRVGSGSAMWFGLELHEVVQGEVERTLRAAGL